MKQVIVAALMIVSVPTLSHGQGERGTAAGHPPKGRPTGPSRVGLGPPSGLAAWKTIDALPDSAAAHTAGLDLRMSPTEEVVEEVTVYGKRHTHAEEEKKVDNFPITIGPATIESSQIQNGSFSGMAVSAAIPIAGVPGLDATFNLSGGHDQLNASTTATSGAVTAGLRLKF
jgi:hypothetical protein